MLGKDIIRILAFGVGLSSVAALVYMAGPFVAFGDWRPLENSIVREIVIVVLLAAAAGVTGFAFWRRKKKSAEIEKGIAEAKGPDSDAEVLTARMKDALATLKGAGKGKRDFLYDLPWYVLIGPPGAGKTTALANSGLKFPLSRGGSPAAVAGLGGTRYCDWWFTEDAVLIDTAGRYTTQDSDARADQKSWLAFLDLLKKNRPRQPINGVIVAIALDDIITEASTTIEAHAAAVRARLLELHNQLKVDFPVYVLFTKADLVAGFREFFGSFNENLRAQVWGATFQTSDKKLNLVGEVPAQFDALIARLNDLTTDRLQDEPVPSTRASLFGFPAQVAALKKPIFNFLNQIFEPTRYSSNATLRGFYFTSGTQEGTPIDQLIGALSRSFGAREVAANAYSGRGQSYFLKDLISKLIIGEAAWVTTDRRAVLRARLIKTAALCVLALVCAGAAFAWWGSYVRNKDLITRTQSAAADYRTAAGSLANETEISDRDLAKVLPLLNKLRYLPAGYETKGTEPPLPATFGLSQFDRLQSASNSAYGLALERLLRPRLIYRLEEQMEANRTDPSFLYEALKVYLMLGGLHPVDRDQVLTYLRRDWADNLYPGAANADGRQLLETHVKAMLDMPGDILIQLNGPLVTEAQNLLARLSVSQQAYELLRGQAAASEVADWNAERAGGPDSALVFESTEGAALDAVKVPAFYTYAGFRRLFIGRLPGIADRLKADRWVLGAAGEQTAVEDQYKSLSDDLLVLYGKDFVAAWRDALGRLKLKRLLADKPKYVTLAAASAPTSPIKQLIQSVRDETALTRDRPGFDKKSDNDKNAALFANSATAPGADIENDFKAFAVLVEGEPTRQPIDLIVGNLANIYQSLLQMGNPALAAQATMQLQQQVAAVRGDANRLPPPFSAMWQTAATDIDADLTNSARSQLSRALRETVTGVCQQIVSNRYPFARSDREVPLVDFGRLFGPQQIIDGFFKGQLAQYVDTSKPNWSFRQDNPISRAMSAATATLKDFQLAAQIRDTFFSSGGALPSMTLTIIPPPAPIPPPPPAPATPGLPGATPPPPPAPPPSVGIKMDMNGTPIISPAGASAPVVAQWPGAGANRSAITVTSDMAGALPSTIERTGPWSLFRLIEAGAPVVRGDKITVSYVVGGRELQYQISAGSTQNPFTLPALREFHCPSDL